MGNENSSQQHAALWRLARNGNAVALRSAIARVPLELQHSYLEFANDKATPLAIAVELGHVECVRVLLNAGVDANRITQDGSSPLHLAVKASNPAITQILVENPRVDCNVVDARGCTPLLLAAMEGHAQVLEVLLYSGDVNIFAYEPQTRMNVLALARKAYSKAPSRDQARFKACLDAIAKRWLVRSGWLYEYADSKTRAGWTWTKRNYVVFRTADPTVVKIDLFPRSGGTLAYPSLEMVWQCSKMIEESTALPSMGLDSIPVSFFQRQFRFTLRVRVLGKHSAVKTVAFAAETQEELTIWRDLPAQLQMAQLAASNATRTRVRFAHGEPQPEPERQALPQQRSSHHERGLMERQMRQLRQEQQQRFQRRQEQQQREQRMREEQEARRLQEAEEEANRQLEGERIQREYEIQQALEAQRLRQEQEATRQRILQEQAVLRLQERIQQEQEARQFQERLLQEQAALRLQEEQEAERLQTLRQDEQEARRLQEQLDQEHEQQLLALALALQQQQQELDRAIEFSLLEADSPSPSAPLNEEDLLSPEPSPASTAGSNVHPETDCIVCFDGAKCAVCIPCGHVAMCMDCAMQVKATSQTCPICRSSVSDVIRIFHV